MAVAETEAPEAPLSPPANEEPLEVSGEQSKVIEGDPGLSEESAPMAERDTPPAKSWAVYQYDSTAVPPAPQCHIYGYNADGTPLTEQEANDLAVALTSLHSGTVMSLPNETKPDVPPPADALEQPHDEQNHDA